MQEQFQELPENFGDRLRFFREGKGLSQAELGAAAGVSGQTISDLERAKAKHPPKITVLERMAEELGCSREHLLFGPRSKEKPESAVEEPRKPFGELPMIALPHQTGDEQRLVRREDCERHLAIFLDEAEKEQARLGWTYEELRDKFPLEKWKKKKD